MKKTKTKRWKLLSILTLCLLTCLLFAVGCKNNKDSLPTSQAPHEHTLRKVYERDATCLQDGCVTHWECTGCGQYFLDAIGKTTATYDEVFCKTLDHSLVKTDAVSANCDHDGSKEFWTCSSCGKLFADANGAKETSKKELKIPAKAHSLTHVSRVEVNGKQNGVKEHWFCSSCEGYFADDKGEEEITEEDVILFSLMNVPDFLVEIPTGRDPIILQLSDTQIIDAGQARDGRTGIDKNFWATGNMDVRCFNYLREIVTATNPDFIIITGDVVYGEFDDNGTALQKFIAVMESFQIPWSPVFGNHDNESKMGVDWQCKQFENAEYCLFEQKQLSGNGNYSVGIAQGGELKRVFYMMDTHACGHASDESLANGHTYKDFAGFKNDQIEWYTKQITILKELSPNTKISFAYHIQQNVFGEALAKYGFDQSKDAQNINLHTMQDKAESDFGYVGAKLKGPWDVNKSVYNGMKALGVDSIFVGHVHENSASVMYDGIRFQFGQKSSEYDRYNLVDANGNISTSNFAAHPSHLTPLVGGSVIVLSEQDGSISDAYIYYCENAGGKIDWESFIEYDVNGIKKGGDFRSENGAVVLTSVKFDETTNAYKLYASSQGKALLNTNLMRNKTTFTFSVFVPSSSTAKLGGMGQFSFRVKPDDGAISSIAGAFIDVTGGNKQYIAFNDKEGTNPAVKIVYDTWQTFNVDISTIANTCTEFAFIIAQGNTIYVKDMAFL